jgi:hypothetical protein
LKDKTQVVIGTDRFPMEWLKLQFVINRKRKRKKNEKLI